MSASVILKDGGVANIMAEQEAHINVKGEGNFKFNVCFKNGGKVYKSLDDTTDYKEHVRSNDSYNSTYVPNICSESIFSGSFWK